MREARQKKINYNYPKYGTTGVFSSDSSQPIEYVLTSLSINEINDLSYAKDIQESTKDFDYLIQRDIDEERARKDICSYLTSASSNKTFFLPPLIVAVVGVDKDNNLIDYYPPMDITKTDTHLIREWSGLFEVTNYFDVQKGSTLKLSHEGSYENIDLEQVLFEMHLPSSSTGGRLVVIDGQHRLFALKHLFEHEREKVNGITIPICIVYSPLSSESNIDRIDELVDVKTTLRKLFIDVNSTVEKVSGHFLTLLSDDNLGSIICREFCSKAYSEIAKDGRGLSLVEWNTKNYKESKTISRAHSITSIGLLNDALYDNFGATKAKVDSLRDLLDFDVSEYSSILAEYETAIDDLPWSTFSIELRNELKVTIKNEIVEHLVRLFFEPKVYATALDIFNELVDEKLVEIRNERDSFSECYNYLKNYYLFNDPIPDSKSLLSKCKTLQSRVNQWHQEQIKDRSQPIAFTAVYQKSILSCWKDITLFGKKKLGIEKSISTSILINLIDETQLKSRRIFEYTQPYMQDNIYNGSRIRATKRTIEQLKFITLAMLGNVDFLKEMSTKFGLTSEQIKLLGDYGKEHASVFFEKLRTEKQKTFAKNYKHNFSLSVEEKRALSEAEELRNTQIYSSTDSENKVDAAITFDELIRSMVKVDLTNCASVLAEKLGFEDFFYLVDFEEIE